ncbi:MAG TPA: VCBS repeat-containing protein [Gemmatimonadales bacterium]|nr:VCBS repeat-containing protein [Gemmatimonadales bacterium]
MTLRSGAAAGVFVTAAAALALGAWHHPVMRQRWTFTADVMAAPVSDTAGKPMIAPFLGGFDVPRPQLVDINGDGVPELFVQEWPDRLIYFERHDGAWAWRTDNYQNIPVGEWYRFVDVDGDGVIDLLSEMPAGYIRMWRNTGTRTAPHFVAFGDTIRDIDGRALVADRQNILNAVDIDCNGKLDLFIGQVQGTVDRYEQAAIGPDGTPRFRLLTTSWEGISILGPEQLFGAPASRNDSVPAGPRAVDPPAARHGANTLTFADLTGKGTLDLFWGDFFEPGLLLIENTGTCAVPNLQSRPVEFPAGHPVLTSGYNAPTFGDVDGDGLTDLVLGVIGGAYGPAHTSVENLYLLQQRPKGTWTTVTRQFITQIDVGSEAIPALGDLYGSGKLDLLIGNKAAPNDENSGTITWFENVGTPTAPAFRDRGVLPIHGEFNYAPTIVDLDGDGKPDIVVGTWRDRVEWYRNTGTRAAPSWVLADSALVIIPRGSNTAPAFADIDGDGLPDLIIGTASGRLLLYRNTGSKTVPRFTLVSDRFQDIKFGRRSVPVLVDMDGDGKPDLLLGNEDGALELWRNVGTGGEFKFALDSGFQLSSYADAAPAVGDLHGKGHLDILVGTGAGGVRWFENGTPH